MALVNFPTLYEQRRQNHHHNHSTNCGTMILPYFSYMLRKLKKLNRNPNYTAIEADIIVL
ncbi:hypothetical protein J1N35_035458 [Gossypium stocksii]|uniref:Uncharacterized protein n=1 Tax=Gossypium stocksii TaxID=47602 RepID=A0A9D3UTY5_9ROSI|nr:hypothetical protein J1N35_035458 [Gossypium stocksii]